MPIKKTWSPFECFPVASLTQSGLLQMEQGEVELMRRDEMELRSAMGEPMLPMIDINNQVDHSTNHREWRGETLDLTFTLTTYRLVLWKEQKRMQGSSSSRQARFIHLSHLISSSPETSIFKSPKIMISTYSGDVQLVFRGTDASKDRDHMLVQLNRAMERQDWEAAAKLESKQKKARNVVARKVGVDAILAKNAMRHKEARRVTEVAFEGDSETLLKEAAELVDIIKKYVATLDQQQEGRLSAQQEEDNDRLSSLLQDMGMASALSKADFRDKGKGSYYSELARQLADFLRQKLKTAGGVMTLTDVYCLYNRARGSNLISPEDLIAAVACMKDLHLGMSEREFPSGVKVIQDDQFDDKVVSSKLKDMAEKQPNGLTSMEAGRLLKISALLAHEQLLAAEQMGYLARDETLESTRFFSNKFHEWSEALLVT